MKRYLSAVALAFCLSCASLGTVAKAEPVVMKANAIQDLINDIRQDIKDLFKDLAELGRDLREFRHDRGAPGPEGGVGLSFVIVAGLIAWRRRRQRASGP